MKKRVIAVIAVLALSVAMFGCKAGSDTGNGKKQREESAREQSSARHAQARIAYLFPEPSARREL